MHQNARKQLNILTIDTPHNVGARDVIGVLQARRLHHFFQGFEGFVVVAVYALGFIAGI